MSSGEIKDLLEIIIPVITIMLGGIATVWRAWYKQRQVKHERERELDILKEKYHSDVETIRVACLTINATNKTQPPEMKKLMEDILKKEIK